jgi:hypothetical protein
MYRAVKQAFTDSGIPWADCYREVVGDSILVLAPPGVRKGAFAGMLPAALAGTLRAHNGTHEPEEWIRLRLSLHAGEVTHDTHGVTGQAITDAYRLLDAQQLKDALANSGTALAMIASDWFYSEVIRHRGEYEPSAYRRFDVKVKRFSGVGWIRLPDHDWPAEPLATVRATTVDASPVSTLEFETPVLMPVLRPSSPQFYEVVDAVEGVSCMRSEHERAAVINDLTFGGSIRYFPSRRMHVISILRSCTEFDTGVTELVTALVNHEPSGSAALSRLLTLLTGSAV